MKETDTPIQINYAWKMEGTFSTLTFTLSVGAIIDSVSVIVLFIFVSALDFRNYFHTDCRLDQVPSNAVPGMGSYL